MLRPVFADIYYGPLRCPDFARWPGDVVGCGSTDVEEGGDVYDCFRCGIFFVWEEGYGADDWDRRIPILIRSEEIETQVLLLDV